MEKEKNKEASPTEYKRKKRESQGQEIP